MANREVVEVNGNKRYIRRDERGRFTSSQADVGRSLSKDRQQKAKRSVKAGQGDRGDRKTS
jgi:hypothetical protein